MKNMTRRFKVGDKVRYEDDNGKTRTSTVCTVKMIRGKANGFQGVMVKADKSCYRGCWSVEKVKGGRK